ncbi:MAG: 6,7-dimethyl-8-ribityllumazine synthase [Prevotella sp.]|nr:6,7-dimethyl-8-ribityllumazine synthase [Bacteroides sp.]MCM1365718.1 6,7-dimethyl-8-ribityllumazine synthase [Prevotella sp.]MCM1436388.1 6,7-dimethyl-8-ribityllumazine synthase [Prevotella sp.]
MATALQTGGAVHKTVSPLSADFKCVIVKAQWNSHITEPLAQAAREYFLKAGIDKRNILTVEVPGAVELVYGASRMIDSVKPDAVIVIGCVIRGDTPHFDYVCKTVTDGVTLMNTKGQTPVIFGLLTVDSEQQAHDRAGGILGNKGTEYAQAAVEMANLSIRYPLPNINKCDK